MKHRAYLDYNATAPVRPEVRAAVEPILFGSFEGGSGNASSVHWAGQAARKALEDARARVAKIFSRKPSEVIFTSGGTESDNLALFGVLRHPSRAAPRLIRSAVEHPAVVAPSVELAREGITVDVLDVDSDGRLDPSKLDRAAGLVSVMAVNNETGVIHPTKDVIEAATCPVHVDAVQAIGRVPIEDFVDADLITISGHKLGGLKGTGALIVKDTVPLASIAVGGPQERGKRAGTEDVAGAVALATALEIAVAHRETEETRLAVLRDRIDGVLRAIDGAHVLGMGAPRVGGTTLAVFEGVDGESVLQGLDLEGIATSSGSACSSGSLEPSAVLLAMGVRESLARTSVRFSLGWGSTEADVNALTAVLPEVVTRAATGRIA